MLLILKKYPGNFIMVHFAIDHLEEDIEKMFLDCKIFTEPF